jgi:hypothetical protein
MPLFHVEVGLPIKSYSPRVIQRLKLFLGHHVSRNRKEWAFFACGFHLNSRVREGAQTII